MVASVLLIDDSRNIRDFCARILRREGLGVVTAGSAREGIDCLDRQVPDLVVLDVHLPGTSGLEVIGRIAAMAPVILYSVHPASFDDPRARVASACVEKQPDLTGLIEAIRRVLAGGALPTGLSAPNGPAG